SWRGSAEDHAEMRTEPRGAPARAVSGGDARLPHEQAPVEHRTAGRHHPERRGRGHDRPLLPPGGRRFSQDEAGTPARRLTDTFVRPLLPSNVAVFTPVYVDMANDRLPIWPYIPLPATGARPQMNEQTHWSTGGLPLPPPLAG